MEIHLTPLPGSQSFINGCYGLQTTYIRGMVTVRLKPSQEDHRHKRRYIQLLKVSLKSSSKVQFVALSESYEPIDRENVFWQDELILLGSDHYNSSHNRRLRASAYQKELKDDTWLMQDDDMTISESIDAPELSLPFELILPENNDKLHPLIPFSCKFEHNTGPFGTSSSATFKGEIKTELSASIIEIVTEPDTFMQSMFHHYPTKKRHSTETELEFPVFYPMHIPKLFFAEPKQWRSAIGTYPCEYDFHLTNSVISPGDELILSYRIAVSEEAKRKGIRIHGVRFILKEIHSVGDSFRASVATETIEVSKWEQYEQPDVLSLLSHSSTSFSSFSNASEQQHGSSGQVLSGSSSIVQSPTSNPVSLFHSLTDTQQWQDTSIVALEEFNSPTIQQHQHPEKDVSIISRSTAFRGGGSGDGIYAECEGIIKIPPEYLTIYNATTPKSIELNTLASHIPVAYIQVKHVVRVDIELVGHERKAFECNVIMLPTSKQALKEILEDQPGILPSPEYDRVVGGETWIPTYHPPSTTE